MIEVRCPKCGSTRIHRGYTDAPFYKRLFGWQNLLCNNCNLLFTAFAWPGAVQRQSRRKRKQHTPLMETSRHRSRTQTALELAQDRTVAEVSREAEAVLDDTFDRIIVSPEAAPSPEPANDIEASISPAPTVSEARRLPSVQPSEAWPELAQVAPGDTRRKRRRHKAPASASQRAAGTVDYVRFGLYYAGVYLKDKFGLRKTQQSLDVKFRWRNWWRWQRSKV